MANLFVVFTPLQVVIAQQIIRQEKLSDCVMLASYWEGYAHFWDIYEMTIIDDMWAKVLFFQDWARWDYEGIGLLKNSLKVRKRYRQIKKILVENKIDTIYLADFQNQTNRFSCFLFAHQGYKIVFYEEGYSHYVPRKSYPPSQSFLHKVYQELIDLTYYLPLYHIKFAEWRCWPNKDYHGLPIHLRYSILPNCHHEKYDRLLKCETMISTKLKSFVSEELQSIGIQSIILLTDPMSEVLPKQYRYLYFEVINEILDQYSGYSICVKFHPREKENDRKEIMNLLKEKEINYTILGKRINIPVEFYLQYHSFKKVLFFNTSTYFYNGYLFPKVQFVKLLPSLYEKCRKSKATDLEQMEGLLKFIG